MPARSGTRSLVCQCAGTPGSAASGRTRRTVRVGAGRGQAGGFSPNAHRQGAQSRTKVPSPRPAVGEPRTRPRRCPCPGNDRVAEDRPGSGRREPGGRHGGGGAGPSRPRPRPAPRAAPQLPETEPSLLLSKLSAQRARVETRSLQPVCPGWALRGGHWFAGARELPPSSARVALTTRPSPTPRHPPPRDPSPCSGAPSGGGSSSSDLRC